jgi:nitroreductase
VTIDVMSVDQALMTTRAVRRRLDLERPVDLDILFECIDIAEQAPCGGNQSSRRWIIIRDQERND